MKVRLGVALLALLLLAVVIAFPRPARTPVEPSYAGRTLTEWVMRNPLAGTQPVSSEAAEAIRKIGTNALPCLLAWLAADPDHIPIKRAARWVLSEVPQPPPAKAIDWAWCDPVLLHLEVAPIAFKVLGADAAPAIPDLERLATDPHDRRGAHYATYILGGIGPQALPALQRIATTPACPARIEARQEAARLLAQSLSNAPDSH